MSEENKLLIQNPEDIKKKLEENFNKIKSKPKLEKKALFSSPSIVEQTTIVQDIKEIEQEKPVKLPQQRIEPSGTTSNKIVTAGVDIAVSLTKAILLLVGGFILLIFILFGLCVLALKN